MRKRIFSGIKPSGNLHIGNYIGSLARWVKLQEEYDSIFCVVDLHAITVPQDPKELKKSIRETVAWYLAAGIDPKKSTIFVQSHNPDHSYLAWILNCFTSVGDLNRMTQYKEKKEKADFISAGLFDYPVLMASDILLYDPDFVPVGDDQKQHIELTRDIAERLNNRYKKVFKIPSYMRAETGERIMSLQNPEKKMSKSDIDPQGTIDLNDSPESIRKKITSAVTDSGNEVKKHKDKPAISNLIDIYVALSGKSEAELDREYSGKGYKKFKEDLAEVVVDKLAPIQNKFKNLVESSQLNITLREGLEHARKISKKKVAEVIDVVGLG